MGKDKPNKYGMLRELGAVEAFKEVMVKRLRENMHKQHWSKCCQGYLYQHMQGNVDGLIGELVGDEVVNTLADIANYAMMIADNSLNGLGHGEDDQEPHKIGERIAERHPIAGTGFVCPNCEGDHFGSKKLDDGTMEYCCHGHESYLHDEGKDPKYPGWPSCGWRGSAEECQLEGGEE